MKAFRLIGFIFGFHLYTVSGYCPEKCICLWHVGDTLEINCSGSEKTQMPYGIDPKVKVLNLSHNDLTDFGRDKYRIDFLEELDLSNNEITRASFGGYFKRLRSIDLSRNSIVHLKKISIRNLKHLKKLNVSRNSGLGRVSGLESDVLEILDLSHCRISIDDDGFLERVPNIREIDISHNSIRSLDKVRSKSLLHLDVSHSEIESLSESEIKNMPELIRLNVSFNPNLKLDFSHTDSCWTIKIMDLSNSKMNALDDLFPFCSIEILNASRNEIESIGVRTFLNNCELIRLDLSENRIFHIDNRSFFTADKLKWLNLSGNRIGDVSFTLHLKRVRELDLSRNRIADLNGLNLKSATRLNLSRNKIAEIDRLNLNEMAPKLTEINLSRNGVDRLGKITSKSLTDLDLSYNSIRTIDSNAFENGENLISIDLTGNKLTELNHGIFAQAKNLRAISLSENPWSCRCRSEQFKKLMEYLRPAGNLSIPDGKLNELKCFGTNETWEKFCRNDRMGKNEWKNTIYSLASSLALAFVLVAAAFACKYLSGRKRTDDGAETEGGSERDERISIDRNISVENFQVSAVGEELSRNCGNCTPPPNYEAALMLPKLTEGNGLNSSSDAIYSSDEIAEMAEIAREDCRSDE